MMHFTEPHTNAATGRHTLPRHWHAHSLTDEHCLEAFTEMFSVQRVNESYGFLPLCVQPEFQGLMNGYTSSPFNMGLTFASNRSVMVLHL